MLAHNEKQTQSLKGGSVCRNCESAERLQAVLYFKALWSHKDDPFHFGITHIYMDDGIHSIVVLDVAPKWSKIFPFKPGLKKGTKALLFLLNENKNTQGFPNSITVKKRNPQSFDTLSTVFEGRIYTMIIQSV